MEYDRMKRFGDTETSEIVSRHGRPSTVSLDCLYGRLASPIVSRAFMELIFFEDAGQAPVYTEALALWNSGQAQMQLRQSTTAYSRCHVSV